SSLACQDRRMMSEHCRPPMSIKERTRPRPPDRRHKPPEKVEAILHDIAIQLASPEGDFPGAIETGKYVVVDNQITLCNAEGVQIGRWHKLEGRDPKKIAARLMRENSGGWRWAHSFNRRIRYPDSGVV